VIPLSLSTWERGLRGKGKEKGKKRGRKGAKGSKRQTGEGERGRGKEP